MPTGTTANFTVTRDKLIEMAYKIIGVLEPGQMLDGDMLQDGIDMLGLIVRETDAGGKWLWTLGDAKHVTLTAKTHRYNAANGLPSNITELVSAYYRDSDGADWPVDILKREQYETIMNKMDIGIVSALYLTEEATLANRVLFVWPALPMITTQAVVTGTDALTYKCIFPHIAEAVNRPITGANYTLAWELGGTSPAAWVSTTAYNCSESIRLTFRRPLFDFDQASDNPDFPLEWPLTILYKLAAKLGDVWGIPLEERQAMLASARGSFTDIYQNVKAKSKDIHNKVRYF